MYFRKMVQYQSLIYYYPKLKYYYVEVPEEILAQLPGRAQKKDFNQRLWITINDTVRWQCGVLALGEGKGLISIQKKRLQDLQIGLNDRVSVALEPDESELGTTIEATILAYWEQVPEAKIAFDALGNGMKRYIINHIQSVKSEQKQLERTQFLFERLLWKPTDQITFRFLLGKED